ncbi:hypothetical protein ACH4F6_16860 [Streptomyces sp. NPDC017936]|uniref:hypothetical protein n=1 Tax=Streptomyces sp. NPDC017936 TaxID=3365016 RepID=UPI0037B355F8
MNSGETQDGADGGGTHITARADNRSRVTVAGRDVNSTYFVSASTAALAALVGLVLLVGVWQPWQETAATGERDRTRAAIGSESPGGSSATTAPDPGPASDGEDDEEPEEPEPSTGPTPSDSPSPDPPDPDDVAFASVGVGTCLNVYDDGWGELNHERPSAVDCGAGFAYSKVTMVTTAATNCPDGAGRRAWGHVNDDGSLIALCLDRVFATGQCFPAILDRQADGSLNGEGRLFTVWGCDRTDVPRGYNAVMAITAVLRGGRCPERTGGQTLSWDVFNGAATVCAVQTET